MILKNIFKFTPRFNKPPYENDIGLMRMIKRIKFTDLIKPITFLNSENIPDHAIGTSTGWGISSKGKPEDLLQIINLTIISNRECEKEAFPGMSTALSDGQMCTLSKKKEGVCNVSFKLFN